MSIFPNFSECAMYPPETKVCGPGGVRCIPGNETVNAVCECMDGWTNIGDFALASNGPCDMNILAVRIIWAITCAINIPRIVFSAWFLWKKYGDQKSWKEAWEKFDEVSLTVIFTGLSGVGYAIASILRAIDPLRFVVGGDLVASLTYSMGIGFFWLCGVTYFSNVISVAHMNLLIKRGKASEQATATLDSIRRMLPFLYVLVILISSLMFVLAIINTSLKGTNSVGKYDQLIVGIAFVGSSAFSVYLGIIMIPRWLDSVIVECEVVLTLMTTLNGTTSAPDLRTERLRGMADKFKYLTKQARKQGTINGIFALLIAFWEYLTHKASYVLPIQVISGVIISMIMIWSFSNFSSTKGATIATEDSRSRASSGKRNSKADHLSIKRKIEALPEPGPSEPSPQE